MCASKESVAFVARAPLTAMVLLYIWALLFLLGRPAPAFAQAQSLVSLNVRAADLVNTLRSLAEMGGLNVIISPDVRGTVTLRLKDVPAEDAFEIVVKTTGLAQVRKGSVISILPYERLLRQQRQEAEARAQPPISLRTEIVKLQFARATELARILASFLSRWGKIAADNRTNSLIIRDSADSSIFQLIEHKRGETDQEAPAPQSNGEEG